MHHLKAVVAASLLCVILTACAPAASTAAPSLRPTEGAASVNASGITANKKGQVLNVKVGDTFDVRISTIPRAGFVWQPQNLDTQILEQQGDPVYEPDPSPNAAGGTIVIKFKAISPGTVPLTLIYASAPSSGAPSLYRESFGITVDVK